VTPCDRGAPASHVPCLISVRVSNANCRRRWRSRRWRRARAGSARVGDMYGTTRSSRRSSPAPPTPPSRPRGTARLRGRAGGPQRAFALARSASTTAALGGERRPDALGAPRAPRPLVRGRSTALPRPVSCRRWRSLQPRHRQGQSRDTIRRCRACAHTACGSAGSSPGPRTSIADAGVNRPATWTVVRDEPCPHPRAAAGRAQRREPRSSPRSSGSPVRRAAAAGVAGWWGVGVRVWCFGGVCVFNFWFFLVILFGFLCFLVLPNTTTQKRGLG